MCLFFTFPSFVSARDACISHSLVMCLTVDNVFRQQCTVFQFVTSLNEEDDDYDTSDHEHEHEADDCESTPRCSVDESKGGKPCLIM